MKTILSFTRFINESLSEDTLSNLIIDVQHFESDQHEEYCDFIESLENKPLWDLKENFYWVQYIKEGDIFVVIVFDKERNQNLPSEYVGIVVDEDTKDVKQAFWGNNLKFNHKTAKILLDTKHFNDRPDIMAIRDLRDYERGRKK